ncbi:MAG: hypothetical protein PHX62_02985 [Bacilli bacterium]|nr:hypothetical protein [Bacilli bacterium]
MELRICCDATVKLEKMTNVNEIYCDIDSFKVNGDTLEGNIRIHGKYIKDDVNIQYDFNELVPYTIVFKDRNYRINNIEVQNLNCQEIINQGIECNFDILVDYTPNSVDSDEDEILKPESVFDAPKVEEIPIGEESEEIAVTAEDDAILSDETIKAEINQKYNDLLNDILEARADENFFEMETKKAITINSGDSKDDCRGFLNKIKSDSKSIKVYYTNKDVDIEQICRNEKVSVDKVYRDNKKSDFINKRRIIIK